MIAALVYVLIALDTGDIEGFGYHVWWNDAGIPMSVQREFLRLNRRRK
jgi:hypothetical protein